MKHNALLSDDTLQKSGHKVGNITRYYVNGTRTDEKLYRIDAIGNAEYFHYDGLGSVVNMTGYGGFKLATYSYDVYGELRKNESIVENDWLFTGRRLDVETGLYDMRARMYDPRLGRFLSQDTYPMDGFNPGTIHRYGYAWNNPANLIDLFGLSPSPCQIMDAIDKLSEKYKNTKNPNIKNAIRQRIGSLFSDYRTASRDQNFNEILASSPGYELSGDLSVFGLSSAIVSLGIDSYSGFVGQWADNIIGNAHIVGAETGGPILVKQAAADTANSLSKRLTFSSKGVMGGLSKISTAVAVGASFYNLGLRAHAYIATY